MHQREIAKLLYKDAGAFAVGALKDRRIAGKPGRSAASLRVCLCQRLRGSRPLIQEFQRLGGDLVAVALPLASFDNEAERALRHWVIVCRICQGTRSEQGTWAFALPASVIETCRKRGILPWPYIAEVIAQRRKGLPAPPLPTAA